MDYEYHIFPDDGLIVEKVRGEVTVEQLLRKAQRIFADPRYDAGLCGVMDLRQARSLLTKVELYAFADTINRSDKFGRAPWAIVANDPMVVALSQVFQQRLDDPTTVAVVGTPPAAADFLQKPVVLQYLDEK